MTAIAFCILSLAVCMTNGASVPIQPGTNSAGLPEEFTETAVSGVAARPSRQAGQLFCTVDIPHCNRCDVSRTDQCVQCEYPYTTTNGKCVMIACNIYDCIECTPSPLVCTKCAPGLVFQNGVCQAPEKPACYVNGCDTCAASNPNVCTMCQDGYTLSNFGAVCEAHTANSCADTNCNLCSVDAPGTCLSCNAGYTLSMGMCFASTCNVSGCTKCVPGQPDTCNRCQSGMTPSGGKCYYISCGIFNCQKCIVGSPSQCTQCAPGFTVQPDGQCAPAQW